MLQVVILITSCFKTAFSIMSIVDLFFRQSAACSLTRLRESMLPDCPSVICRQLWSSTIVVTRDEVSSDLPACVRIVVLGRHFALLLAAVVVATQYMERLMILHRIVEVLLTCSDHC